MTRSFAAIAAVGTVLGGLFGSSAALAQEAPVRHLTVDEAVTSALARNTDVMTAGEEVNVASAQASGTRGMFGPKVHVDGSLQVWNEAYVFGGFPVHDQVVWNVTASIAQPISGLFAIYDAYKVRELGVDIAAVKRDVARRDVAYRTVESFYRLGQAQRLSEVAVASVDQLNAQLRQAKSFHDNGVVSQDDVLRAQLAVANAQQRLIQTRARITVERGKLAVLMGLSPDTVIDAQPLAAGTAGAMPALTLEQAEKSAETQRIELREVDKRIELSDHDTRLAYLKLAPQISAVGAYIHNEGSLFSQINAGYVGGVLSWDVWDWGTTTSGISEAKSRARQAALARIKVGNQIRLEVRQAYIGVGTANEAMEVAKAAVASAEENFRLVKKRYEANAATSFDVVDAEALLTQARGQMETALYDLAVARAALRAAVGVTPEAVAHD